MDIIPEFYPESDDSYLLMDSLKLDNNFLLSRLSVGPVTVEVGPGGGSVSKYFMDLVEREATSVFHLAVDVNRYAGVETRSQFVGSACVDVILADMFSGMRPEVLVDVIFCNPPYVPSSPINGARDIRASYAGGERGREFIDAFLPRVADRLSDKGVFYFLLEKRNDIEEVVCMARDRFGLEATLILDRKIRGEHLFVYRFIRCSS